MRVAYSEKWVKENLGRGVKELPIILTLILFLEKVTPTTCYPPLLFFVSYLFFLFKWWMRSLFMACVVHSA